MISRHLFLKLSLYVYINNHGDNIPGSLVAPPGSLFYFFLCTVLQTTIKMPGESLTPIDWNTEHWWHIPGIHKALILYCEYLTGADPVSLIWGGGCCGSHLSFVAIRQEKGRLVPKNLSNLAGNNILICLCFEFFIYDISKGLRVTAVTTRRGPRFETFMVYWYIKILKIWSTADRRTVKAKYNIHRHFHMSSNLI